MSMSNLKNDGDNFIKIYAALAAEKKAIEDAKRIYAIPPITLSQDIDDKFTIITLNEVLWKIDIIKKKVAAEASMLTPASGGNNPPIVVNSESMLHIIAGANNTPAICPPVYRPDSDSLRVIFEFACAQTHTPSVVSNQEGQLPYTKSCKYVIYCMIDKWQQISIYNYDNKDVIKNDSLDDKPFLNTILQSLISNILRAFNINESLI